MFLLVYLPHPSSEELVRFHKMFHSSLSAMKDVQDEEELLWRFLHVLESNMPYITVYGPFLASQQPIRRKVGVACGCGIGGACSPTEFMSCPQIALYH